MRGEHVAVWLSSGLVLGSSLHARGTLSYSRFHSLCTGIIPACAGNTYDTLAQSSSARDHPRMRGEHCFCDLCHILGVGSSPHARGTHLPGGHGSPGRGIIPACAGNTDIRTLGYDPYKDHPRMRGEHCDYCVCMLSIWGSSPHARGTLFDAQKIVELPGIIPACAGNTSSICRPSSSLGDHPRMRGEHFTVINIAAPFTGSSPHARGTRTNVLCYRYWAGIIPACAGNTCKTD